MARSFGASLLVVLVMGGCARSPGAGTPEVSATPSSTPTTSPTATAAPAVAPTMHPTATAQSPGLAWHEVGAFPGDARGLIAFADGYVALVGLDGSVRYSADGRSWQSISLPTPAGASPDSNGLLGRAIATDGRSVLIVGGYEHPPCTEPGEHLSPGSGPGCEASPIAWHSDDGSTWQMSLPPRPAGSTQSEFVAAWPDGSGGWEAALSSWTGEMLAGDTIYRSTDGVGWQAWGRIDSRWEGYDAPVVLSDPTGHRVLTTNDLSRPDTTLMTSDDGRAWTTLCTLQGARITAGLSLADASGPWLLGGPGSAEPAQAEQIWASRDGATWTSLGVPRNPGAPSDGCQAITAFAASPLGLISVAGSCNGDASEGIHSTFRSQDGFGWSLVRDASWPVMERAPVLVASGVAGVIGVGIGLDEDTSTVWELR